MEITELKKTNKYNTQKIRIHNGKPVIATKYIGHWAGYGNYMAGKIDETLICDENGKPIPLKKIGYLV